MTTNMCQKDKLPNERYHLLFRSLALVFFLNVFQVAQLIRALATVLFLFFFKGVNIIIFRPALCCSLIGLTVYKSKKKKNYKAGQQNLKIFTNNAVP